VERGWSKMALAAATIFAVSVPTTWLVPWVTVIGRSVFFTQKSGREFRAQWSLPECRRYRSGPGRAPLVKPQEIEITEWIDQPQIRRRG